MAERSSVMGVSRPPSSGAEISVDELGDNIHILDGGGLVAETICIVDDEPAILNSLSSILEDEGYQVSHRDQWG